MSITSIDLTSRDGLKEAPTTEVFDALESRTSKTSDRVYPEGEHESIKLKLCIIDKPALRETFYNIYGAGFEAKAIPLVQPDYLPIHSMDSWFVQQCSRFFLSARATANSIVLNAEELLANTTRHQGSFGWPGPPTLLFLPRTSSHLRILDWPGPPPLRLILKHNKLHRLRADS